MTCGCQDTRWMPRGERAYWCACVSPPPSVCMCAPNMQPDDQGPPGSFNSLPGTWPRLNYGNPADSWNRLDRGTAEEMSRVVFFLSFGWESGKEKGSAF